MRKGTSDEEKAGRPQSRATPDELAAELAKPPKRTGETDAELSDLEEGRDAGQLTPLDHRLLCDKVDIRALRLSPVLVTRVEADKIHYLPGETVRAKAWVRGGKEAGAWKLVADEITEVDAARPVFAKELQLGPESQTVEFEFRLTDREFGHELRCSLRREAEAKHDVEDFNDVLRTLPAADLGPVVDFLVGTETREVIPMAFALMNRLPPDKAKACRAKLAGAKLAEIRLLAAE